MKIIHLFEGYKEAEADFVKFADVNSVKKAIEDYKLLVNKNQFQGQERNIDFWRKQGWDAFVQRVQMVAAQPTKTQIKRKQVVGKSIFVNETDEWLIVVPLDKDASCFHGRKTQWCTTVPTASHFENYFYDRSIMLIYCINKETGSKWAIATHTDLDEVEMFDQDDRALSGGEFRSATGLDPDEIVKQAMDVAHPHAEVERGSYKSTVAELTQLYQNNRFRPRTKSVEDMLLKTKHTKLIRYYLQANGKDNYPDALVLAAISSGVDGINYFKYQENPSASFIKSAVRIDPEIAKYIPNLDESLQMLLINDVIGNIQWIQNPTEKVQLEVLDLDPEYLEHIRGVTPKAEEFAIKKDPTLIKYAHWHSESSQLVAVDYDPDLLKYCYKPSDNVILAAVKLDDGALQHVDTEEFSTELQLKIVNVNTEAIAIMHRVSPEVMLAAVKKEPTSIISIVNNEFIDKNTIPVECYENAVHGAKTLRDQDNIFYNIQDHAPVDLIWDAYGDKWLNFVERKNHTLSILSGKEFDEEVFDLYSNDTVVDMRVFMKRVYASKSLTPEVDKGSDEIKAFLDHLKSLFYK